MDIFGTQASGQYGITSLKNLANAANSLYDLFDAIYLDDRKLGPDDLADAFRLGPAVLNSVMAAANTANQLDEELTDLSEAEKAELAALAGARLKRPGYVKIVKGLLELTDGVSELLNAENPTE